MLCPCSAIPNPNLFSSLYPMNCGIVGYRSSELCFMKFKFMATGHMSFASFQASLGEGIFSFLIVLHLLIGNFNFPFNPDMSKIQGSISSRLLGGWTRSSPSHKEDLELRPPLGTSLKQFYLQSWVPKACLFQMLHGHTAQWEWRWALNVATHDSDSVSGLERRKCVLVE